MVMQNAAADLSADDRLTDQDFRVFVTLLGRLDWENYLILSITDLAQSMGRSRPSISKSIGRLVAVGALIKGPRSGTMTTYRLSPDTGWKGSHRGRSALQNKIDQQGWTVHEGGREKAGGPEQVPEIPGQTTIDG